MSIIVQEVKKALQAAADPKIKRSEQRFFKEEITVYGVKAAKTNAIARQFHDQLKVLGKEKAFTICEELFKSGYLEATCIAATWADRFDKDFVERDIEIFEHWIDAYINNWATCDTLCNHAVGSLLTRFPTNLVHLKKWAQSKNRWKRRAAAVSLIIPAKNGLFLSDIFTIADRLLCDNDDMVQKGYGWMLKEASKLHQQEVFDYVMKHKDVMPRTALRYAIEKMPILLKKKAMSK